MGADADAKIIYGFAFQGNDFDFDDEQYGEDCEEWLATHQGLLKPKGSWDDDPDANQAYYDERDKLPLDLERDGDMMSGEGNTYLVIKEATLSGHWGGATKIPLSHVRPPPWEWIRLFHKFCEKAGISGDPDWLLIAKYG